MRTAIVVVVAVCAVLVGALWWRDQAPAPSGTLTGARLATPSPGQVPSRSASRTSPESTPGLATSAGDEAVVETEAKRFIATLTEPDPKPLAADRADHFVTEEQVISLLPEASVETTTRAALAADPDIAPSTPITVVREVEQIEVTTPERLIAEAGGDLETRVRIVEGDAVREVTVREVLEQHSGTSEAPILVMKRVKHFEITTPAELAADESLGADEPLQIIRKPYRIEAATVADLIAASQRINPGSVFYVRTVRSSDEQGIWGIIHDAIIGNFARGMAIRRGEDVDTYKVEIPYDADELLSNRSSSFLGRLIHVKTRESWVYNFKENRMGRNPDAVYPGQEIVIVNFEPEELISIYKHFLDAEG